MKKRTLYVLMSLLVVASMVLAACGSTPTPAAQPVTPKPQPPKLEERQGKLAITRVTDLDPVTAGNQSGVRVMATYFLKDPTAMSQTILVVSTARGSVYLHPNEVGTFIDFTLEDFESVQVGILGGPMCPWAPIEQHTLFECPAP